MKIEISSEDISSKMIDEIRRILKRAKKKNDALKEAVQLIKNEMK